MSKIDKTFKMAAIAASIVAAFAQTGFPQTPHPPSQVGIHVGGPLPPKPEPKASLETPPPAAPAKNFNVPRVEKMTLPNGLEVRLAPYGSVPKVTVRLVTQCGSAAEPADQIWIAQLTGEMLQQGTAKRSAADIARESAKMGGEIEVAPGVNETTIGTDVLTEWGPAAVALVADIARNPKFPESELARIKGDLVRQLSIAKSQPQSIANEKFLAVLYPNQPYGRSFPTQASLEALTLDQVKAFYERGFGAASSRLYVAGVFDAAAMKEAITGAFGDWKRGNAAVPPVVSAAPRRAVYLVDRPKAVQSTLYIGLQTLDPTNPDYIPMVVTDSLLGGSFGSRITSNIREQKGYTYSPRSIVSNRLHAGHWAEIADVTTNATGPSIKEILGEIDKLRAIPPSDAELHGIQNYLSGFFVLRNSSRVGIITQLAFLDLHGLSEDLLRTYVQRIYAVTPADVQRVTVKYLDPAKMAIVVAGDKSMILDQIKPFGEVVE